MTWRWYLRWGATDAELEMVLHGSVPIGKTPAPYDFTWAFVVRTIARRSTRLVVRERYAYLRRWAPIVVEPTQLVSFVMSRRMLRGIKARAELGAESNEIWTLVS
jgi:hypothetical protein